MIGSCSLTSQNWQQYWNIQVWVLIFKRYIFEFACFYCYFWVIIACACCFWLIFVCCFCFCVVHCALLLFLCCICSLMLYVNALCVVNAQQTSPSWSVYLRHRGFSDSSANTLFPILHPAPHSENIQILCLDVQQPFPARISDMNYIPKKEKRH